MLAAHPSRHAVRAVRLNLAIPTGQSLIHHTLGSAASSFSESTQTVQTPLLLSEPPVPATASSPQKLLLSRTLPQLSRARRGSSATLRARVLREQIRLCLGLTIMRFSI